MIFDFGSWARPALVLVTLARAALVPAAADEEAGCDQAPPFADMACIARGPAIIGSDNDSPAESPAHRVDISAFFIDRYEVTNGKYSECEKAGKCPTRKTPDFYKTYMADDLPMIPATWDMANQFCVWAGKRLPTEAEWEKAARGGEHGWRYPWGNEPASCERAAYEACLPKHTRPVGSYPPGAYGVHDLAGNGYEWVNDWASDCYDGCERPCGKACLRTDPKGPCDGAPICAGHNKRVLKGGSWYWPADQLRGAWRRAEEPDSGLHRLSFRCAASADGTGTH
jgi:formylglycine-generating enzyme required for sulfatase activity